MFESLPQEKTLARQVRGFPGLTRFRWNRARLRRSTSLSLDSVHFVDFIHLESNVRIASARKNPALRDWVFSCGSEGIRTPGRLPYAGFQNRCLRPLGHASAAVRG